MNSSADRIEREIVLAAPIARVWGALANAEEFGNWFGVALKGKSFAVGESAKGQITYPGYEHLVWEVVIECLESPSRMSFRWHPYAVDPAVDYSGEPTTLVEFTLREVEGGTLVRIVESGFDKIPPSRREKAFRMNSGGWDEQLKNIAEHVAKP
jgi:uncharacterized protein YndB with AHSA1/START domain